MELESTNGNRESPNEISEAHISLIVVLFVFSVLILVGNLLTIVSILQFTIRKNTLSLLIVSLSFTEVLNVLGSNGIALYVIFDENKEFKDLFTLCRVQAWTVIFLRIAATLEITLLGLDRVFNTALPHFYRKRWKGKLFVFFFFGIWICATFVATWPLLWLEGFSISNDTQGTFCLFPYDSSFAKFFVLFHVCLLAISCFSFYTIFTKSNKKSFSTKMAKDVDLDVSSRQLITERGIHTSTKDLSRLVALVVVVYFGCLLPWIVAISLGIFSVEYPRLFGLCATQLPMISGFLNPLLYGILWPPYRRGYIRALKWPGTKCCNRQSSSRARSHTLKSTLSANHGSFWLSDSLVDEDGDHENAFQILFGPTSYIKPLDFNPEELEMFEQDSKLCASSHNKGGVPRQTKPTVWRETGNHFQNILDLIDAMTDGSRKKLCENGTEKANKESKWPNDDSTHNRSANSNSAGISRHSSGLELSFRHSNPSLIPGVHQCRKHSNGYSDCSCLGKSKCYVVERKNRELDFLVSKEIMESTGIAESVRIDEMT